MLKHCGECGGEIALVAKAGRTARYAGQTVEVPADLEIPTCTGCGEEYFNEEYAGKFDDALKKALETTKAT